MSEHNQYRASIAAGKIKLGRPGPQPQAANMMEVTWDKDIVNIAQRWAKRCDLDYVENATVNGMKLGQNVFIALGLFGNWKYTIEEWYDSVSDFDNGQVDKYVLNRLLVLS